MKRREFLQSSAVSVFMGGTVAAHAAVPITLPDYNMPEKFLPREVRLRNDLDPFEIHVDPGQYALYWTLPDKRAIRYAVGIGRTHLYEHGEFFVGAKKEWPSWTPTPEMIERDPQSYARFADGMPGGLNNPLGSRGLYLFTPSRGDTFLRIHGTNDPETIGRRVSNGCARLINDQMIDLYDRVPLKTRVVLYPIGRT
ncbi:L,D-transpeptidase [Roseobacter denitrificans]|uniref:ErfK/YbiS/YcfS/YnhG family protein n=1 Tax=Roseobacter denitrificans (strain ATCC 33942 / OCh 114) TaxID=375451 RepID=Q16B69_ROSDO|nr:ErfK/YbiS/YcfS/YnhG family protein [Roseobacter denitrificans OCh 114]AVL53883.1 L,D-transpeptidase [Roseobacter denitrificans]SFG46951.1 L,D-transpeptidase catalytic domain [Roseobacter denitrificans OCh 114]